MRTLAGDLMGGLTVIFVIGTLTFGLAGFVLGALIF